MPLTGSGSLTKPQPRCWLELWFTLRILLGEFASQLTHVVVGRLQVLTGYWPKRSFPSYVTCGLFHRATHSMAIGFFQKEMTEGEREREGGRE